MGTRTATLVLTATFSALILIAGACGEPESGPECCNCTCYRIDMCDPAQDYTIYPENSENCETACDDKCSAYYCYSQDPEECEPEEGGGE